jgi:hypothetical protein
LLLSKLVGALADVRQTVCRRLRVVGKSPEVGASREAISWGAPDAGRGAVSEIQVEAR